MHKIDIEYAAHAIAMDSIRLFVEQPKQSSYVSSYEIEKYASKSAEVYAKAFKAACKELEKHY